MKIMDTVTLKKTITTILVLNFIPLVIAVLTLIMVLYFGGYYNMMRPTLEGITITILLAVLPMLGIRTYTATFIHRNELGKKWIWELGCINSGIWVIIFLGIIIYKFLVNDLKNPIPSESLLPFVSLIYFGYLFFLNKKMFEFERIEN
jgi:hypothetical protein